jgi:hypothetical protein
MSTRSVDLMKKKPLERKKALAKDTLSNGRGHGGICPRPRQDYWRLKKKIEMTRTEIGGVGGQ